jgi:predicted nucleic acid-binding protein
VNYLLDTNVVSEIRKGHRCHANVARWYESVAGGDLFLSVLVVGELRKGIERIRAKDAAHAKALEKWLAGLGDQFRERVLPIDLIVADEWGRMNAIRSLPVMDGLLAATAKVHSMILVTRNTPDVAGLNVTLLNPFERLERS